MRRGFRLPLAAELLGVAALTSCAGNDGPPTRLVDGSRAGTPPTLEGAEDVVRTRIRVVDPDRLTPGSLAAACLRRAAVSSRTSRAVVRVGVSGESVTYRSSSGRHLHACEDSAGTREGNRRWCGEAFGHLDGGRLRDPRLDLAACTTASGDPVAFAWLQPGPRAAYVGVRQHGFVEAYEVAGEVPVRIATTTNIELRESRAAFDVSEYDAAGRLLGDDALWARVAG